MIGVYQNKIGSYQGKIGIFSDNSGNTIKDFDGNIYTSVVIGTQTWLQQSLKTTHYNNGDLIETPGQWPVNGDENNVNDYGRLYSLNVYYDIRGICPNGYHLPTYAEFNTLSIYLGGDSMAGGKLAETGLTYWNSPNVDATNETSFNGRGSGLISAGIYYQFKNYLFMWSSTDQAVNTSYYCDITYDYINGLPEDGRFSYDGYYNYANGLSIRLIKN